MTTSPASHDVLLRHAVEDERVAARDAVADDARGVRAQVEAETALVSSVSSVTRALRRDTFVTRPTSPEAVTTDR